MDVKADDRKGKEELILAFFELELLHLLKSGNQNPKITEHFMKRVKEFMELSDKEMTFPIIVLGDIESVRNLAGVINRIKTDINDIEDRVNKLKQELRKLDNQSSEAIIPPKTLDDQRKPKM
jgi:hypothetical protein